MYSYHNLEGALISIFIRIVQFAVLCSAGVDATLLIFFDGLLGPFDKTLVIILGVFITHFQTDKFFTRRCLNASNLDVTVNGPRVSLPHRSLKSFIQDFPNR